MLSKPACVWCCRYAFIFCVCFLLLYFTNFMLGAQEVHPVGVAPELPFGSRNRAESSYHDARVIDSFHAFCSGLAKGLRIKSSSSRVNSRPLNKPACLCLCWIGLGTGPGNDIECMAMYIMTMIALQALLVLGRPSQATFLASSSWSTASCLASSDTASS